MNTKTSSGTFIQIGFFWICIVIISSLSGFIGAALRDSLIQTPEQNFSFEQSRVRQDSPLGEQRDTEQLQDILSTVGKSLVSLYRGRDDGRHVLDRIPNDSQFLAYALVVTSDGWLVTSDSLTDLRSAIAAIDTDGNRYEVKKILTDEQAGYIFLKIDGRNLSAIDFPSLVDSSGVGDAFLIQDHKTLERITITAPQYPRSRSANDDIRTTRSLDKMLNPNEQFERLCMPIALSKKFIIGCTTKRGIRSFRYLHRSLEDLLRKGTIERSQITIPYIDLSAVPAGVHATYQKGALITLGGKKSMRLKNAEGQWTTIADGDVIISVNGEAVDQNRNLSELFHQYTRGVSIMLHIFSAGREYDKTIILN